MPANAPQIYSGPQTMSAAPGTTAGDLQTLLNLGTSAYSLYNSGQLNSEAQTSFQQSNPFGAYRPYYGGQLLQLMQDPSSVTKLPGYNFLLDQGVQAIDRSAAAPGGKGLGSGGEMTDLETFGQGLADQFYNQQVQTLAKLAGADINPANPAQALQTAGAAASGIGSSIQSLSSAIPGTLSLLQRLFPGTSSGSTLGLDTTGSFDQFSASSGFDPVTGTYSNYGSTSDPYSLNTSADPFGMNSGYDPTTGTFDSGGGSSIDTTDLFGNPSAAGGEAATIGGSPTGSSLNFGSSVSDLESAYGAYSGFASGTPTGEAAGALDTTKLVAALSGDTALSAGSNLGLGALGVYSGIEQGGAAGDINAGLGAAQLAGEGANLASGGAAAAGAAGGAAGALSTVGAVAGAIAPIVGIALYGAESSPYTLGPAYYQRVNQTFNNLVAGGIDDPNFITNYDELTNGGTELMNDGSNGPAVPILSSTQRDVLSQMYQQYLAQNMPWITGQPPVGPLGPGQARGGGGLSFRTAQS